MIDKFYIRYRDDLLMVRPVDNDDVIEFLVYSPLSTQRFTPVVNDEYVEQWLQNDKPTQLAQTIGRLIEQHDIRYGSDGY
jgi:hypothetical protein